MSVFNRQSKKVIAIRESASISLIAPNIQSNQANLVIDTPQDIFILREKLLPDIEV